MATDLVAGLERTLHEHGMIVPHHDEHESLISYTKHIIDTLDSDDGESPEDDLQSAQLSRVGSQPHLHREASLPQSRFQTLNLSRNGAGIMADDPKGKKPPKSDDQGGDDDLDFGDDDLGGDDDAGGGADMGGEGDSESATISEVSSELEEMGLMIDPSKDAQEFLEHLATAIKTHKATKGLGAGTDDTGGDMATPEQNQFTMMSRRVEAAERRNLVLETDLAKRTMAEVCANLDLAVSAGLLTQEKCDGYKAKLKAKSLSLVRQGDSEISTIVTLAKEFAETAKRMAHDGLLGGRIDMSKAQAAPGANWGSDDTPDPKKVKEFRDKLTTKGPAA